MRAIIVAVSPEGVIGVRGRIPWHYPGDMKRFKRVTMGGVLVMGRVTFESIGSKPLAGRRNVVITSQSLNVAGVERAMSVEDAIGRTDEADVWFIGGAKVYECAMPWCTILDVTYVPDRIETTDAVRMPRIDDDLFESGPLLQHEDEPALSRRIYTRRSGP